MKSAIDLSNEVQSKNFSDIQKEIWFMKQQATFRRKEVIDEIDADIQKYINEMNEFKKNFIKVSTDRMSIEDKFYDDLLEFYGNTEKYKNELTQKYNENLNIIETQMSQVDKDYKLLRKNYFSIKSINNNLNIFKTDVFNKYYAGYDIFYNLFKEINNQFNDFTMGIKNFFSDIFSKNLLKFNSNLNFEIFQNLDKYKDNLGSIRDDKIDFDQDEDAIDHYSNLVSIVLNANDIMQTVDENEKKVTEKIKSRNLTK